MHIPWLTTDIGCQSKLKPFFQLSYDVDEKKMREVFRLAGRVMNVTLNRDKEGKSRGHGIIEYTHPVESVQVSDVLVFLKRRSG